MMRSLCFGCVILLVAALPALADALDLSEVTFGAGVVAGADHDSQGLHLLAPDIPNPLSLSLSGALGSSQCQADIDLAWASSFASFLVQSDQEAAGLPTSTVYSGASGSIWVNTVSEPICLNIDSVWNYSLPVGFMAGHFKVRVYSPGSPPTVLFHEEYAPQSIPGEPTSGTLSIQGDIILPPGPTWIMTYTMESSAYSGTQGYAATGDGYVNLQITPEPFTLALFAPLLLVLQRRRRPAR